MASFVKDVEEIRQRAIQKIEEGPVTAGYKGDKDRSIAILNDALATEIVCVLRYMHHYFMATGVHGRSVADEFKEHADNEREHSDELAERIQQLGGKPDYNPASLLQRSVSQYKEGESLADMIREDLIAERMVIEVYQDMIRHFGDDDPTTRILLEHILSEEEEHASELSDLLYVVDPRTGESEGEDPGADPLSGPEGREDSGRGRRSQQSLEEDEYEPALTRGEGRDRSRSRERGNDSRRKNGEERVRGRDREYSGIQGEVTRPEQKTTRGGRATGSAAQNKPAHAPGTSGRPMNRRQSVQEPSEQEPAESPNRGGMSGGTRSPKVLQKNRKNKRAA